MNYRNESPAKSDRTKMAPTRDAVRQTPVEDQARLYLLAYLLTADSAKAERCFAHGLDLAAEDNEAVRDWAHSWARRIVICNALQLIVPEPERESASKALNRPDSAEEDRGRFAEVNKHGLLSRGGPALMSDPGRHDSNQNLSEHSFNHQQAM
jgi:hypothetical protein